MIQINQTTIELQSIDVSTRLVLDTTSSSAMVAHLGGPEDGFIGGDYIEVINKGPAAFTFASKPGSSLVSEPTETFAGSLTLLPGATARVLFNDGVWEVQQQPTGGGYLFQVGAVANADHYHQAFLQITDAKALIQATNPYLAVGDVAQPSVVITSADNGNSNTHSHNLTVMFDYTNHKFIVTTISNNPNGNDTPHVAWMVGDIIPTPGAAYSVLTSDGPNATPYWDTPAPGVELLDDLTDVNFGPYPPDNGEVLTFNSSIGAWEPQTPQAQPYDLKGRPMETVPLTGTAETIGSARHHNTHFRCTAATAVVITIPLDNSWGFDQWYENGGFPINPGPMPPGGSMIIGKHGLGNVTFAPAPGVTINTPDTLTISNLHGKATLIKVDTNVWDIEGNIGA